MVHSAEESAPLPVWNIILSPYSANDTTYVYDSQGVIGEILENAKVSLNIVNNAVSDNNRANVVSADSAGLAAGSMVDQLTNSAKDIGRDIGGAIGAAGQFYAMNRQAQYMSHPEIVAKMVESAPNITGAEVIEILKVHSITNGKHSVKINCDYKTLRTDKVKYNKNISIEKSYNQFDDLMNVINTHR